MKAGEIFQKIIDFVILPPKLTPSEWIGRFSISERGMLKAKDGPLFEKDTCPRCKQNPSFCVDSTRETSIYKKNSQLIFGKCCMCGQTGILYNLKSVEWDRPSMDEISEYNYTQKF